MSASANLPQTREAALDAYARFIQRSMEIAFEEALDEAMAAGADTAAATITATAAAEQAALYAEAQLGKHDLFYLLVFLLGRVDANRDWVFARCREVQADCDDTLDLWARYHFKAVDVNEPVMTPSGWRAHGELVAGDHVFGPDGKPTLVVAKTPVFTNADCFKVSFCDGYSVVVSGDHLWTVDMGFRGRLPGGGRAKTRSITMPTRDLMGHVASAAGIESRRYPKIAVAGSLDLPTVDLPLDPYLLGVWLGDGTSDGPMITAGLADAEEMSALLAETGIQVRERRHSNAVTIAIGSGIRGKKGSSDVMNALRGLDVVKNKHIPRAYMMAAEHQRWALLQGLMDTDGSCAKASPQVIFCGSSDRLTEDVFELAQSLGLKATRALRHGLYRDAMRPFWQVQFLGRADRPPFRMGRKRARCTGGHGVRGKSRRVMKIVPVPSQPVSCIQVAREDGLYLVGRHLVPTHNSSIITQALTIQEILRDPEITICIFSDVNKVARPFLTQIMRELSSNERLKTLYPDVLWASPEKEAPKWSEQEGIIVKRQGNPKEATLEAYGLIDGMPTGRHFKLRIYDDLVTVNSVTSPEMMQKVTDRLRLSHALKAEGGRVRYAGTRYHALDPYAALIETGRVKVRKHPATDTGREDGKPVLMTQEALDNERTDMGPFIFAAQMLMDPAADRAIGFDPAWLRFWPAKSKNNLNVYITVDPSSGRKGTKKNNGNDFTAMWVVGAGADHKRYVLDHVRERLSLTKRCELLFDLVREYGPLAVGYEEYGLQADIDYINVEMERLNYRFTVVPLGGRLGKSDRIRRLIPWFEQGNILLPDNLMRVNQERRSYMPIRDFMTEEYAAFPLGKHDDSLDALARILDPDLGVMEPTEQAVAVGQMNRPRLPQHILRAAKARSQPQDWRAL